MSVLRDIRAALEAKTITASGMLPEEQRQFEDIVYVPTPGKPFVRSSFMPSSGRPFSLTGGTKTHMGLFELAAIFPTAQGIDAAEVLADAMKDVFAPSTRIVAGTSDIVLIDYAERGPAMQDGAWIAVPITVGWRCYSTRN